MFVAAGWEGQNTPGEDDGPDLEMREIVLFINKIRLMVISTLYSNTEIFSKPFYLYKSNFDFGNQLICPSFNIFKQLHPFQEHNLQIF